MSRALVERLLRECKAELEAAEQRRRIKDIFVAELGWLPEDLERFAARKRPAPPQSLGPRPGDAAAG
jgi:hypothetical protein